MTVREPLFSSELFFSEFSFWHLACPPGGNSTLMRPYLQEVILWMDEIVHQLRNPGMMIPLQIPTENGCHGFKVVQDFVHPQQDSLCPPASGQRTKCAADLVGRSRVARLGLDPSRVAPGPGACCLFSLSVTTWVGIRELVGPQEFLVRCFDTH